MYKKMSVIAFLLMGVVGGIHALPNTATEVLFPETSHFMSVGQQSTKPFFGQWASDEIFMDIDFYENSLSDPNSMDGDPCAGILKLMKGDDSATYTILRMKVTGKKAVGVLSDSNFKEQPMSAEVLPDGTMKIVIPPLPLIHMEGGKTIFKGEKILKRKVVSE